MLSKASLLREDIIIGYNFVRYPVEISLIDNRKFFCYICYELSTNSTQPDQFFIDESTFFEVNEKGFPVEHSLNTAEFFKLEEELKNRFINSMKNDLFSQKK